MQRVIAKITDEWLHILLLIESIFFVNIVEHIGIAFAKETAPFWTNVFFFVFCLITVQYFQMKVIIYVLKTQYLKHYWVRKNSLGAPYSYRVPAML